MHNQPIDISILRLKKAQKEIVSFDTTLDELQQLYPENEEIWDCIANTRDKLFVLQQQLHNQKTIDNSRMWQDVAQEEEDMELYHEPSLW